MSDKHQDVALILKLYELRREEGLRRARRWYFAEFNPQSVDDILKVWGSGHDGSAHFRMITSYWDMAASLVNNGAIDEQMFNDCNGEHLFVFAKIEPILEELRQTWNQPDMMKNFETLVRRIPNNKETLAAMRERIKMIQGMMAERAAKAKAAAQA